MTGDAPQPGETPRDDGSPWSYADPASPWWPADGQNSAADRSRDERRRGAPAPTLDPPQPAQHTGEAAAAHEAGAQDVRAALTGEAPRQATFPVRPAAPELKAPEQQAPEQQAPEQQAAEQQAAEQKAPEQEAAEQQAAEEPATPRQTEAREPATPRHAQPAREHAQPAREHAQPAREHAEPDGATPRPAEPQPESAKATEHDHDQVDAERFNTEGEGTRYAARDRVPPAAEPEREPTIVDLLNAIPAEPPRAEVMVLPEPDRNRPTVSLDRGATPGRQHSGLSRPGRTREDPARADRALQDRVRQERTAALLETSPFWKAEEERRALLSASPAETHGRATAVRRASHRRPRPPRRPVSGLFGLLTLGLVAAFFAWVSAEPFWLAVGHGDRGVATVTRCTGSGVSQRCLGQFTAANGAYRVDGLALYGVEAGQRAPGANSPARMVSSGSRQAYVGDTGVLVHLRWALGFLLVLLCGLGIAGLTGARRLDTARARRGALLASMAAPLILLGGFLSVTY